MLIAATITNESHLVYLLQLKAQGKSTATSEELARLFGIWRCRTAWQVLHWWQCSSPAL